MIHTLFPFVSSKCNSSFFYRPRLCLVVFFLPNGLTLKWPTPEPSFEFVLIYPHFFNHRRVLKAIYVPMAFAFLFLVHTFLNLRFACPYVHFTSSHACLIGDFFLSWNVTSSPHPPSDPPPPGKSCFPHSLHLSEWSPLLALCSTLGITHDFSLFLTPYV